jgi:hypothetical protein
MQIIKAYELVALFNGFEHSLYPKRMINSVITMGVLSLTAGMFRIALRGLISRLFLKQSGVW